MLKNNNRPKSTARRPLVDISNGGKPSRPFKKKIPTVDHTAVPVDRLLLVRSQLSDLVGQIDELVAQALEHKVMSKKGSQNIESFGAVLSDMRSSLKPWVSRLRQSFSNSLASSENQLAPAQEGTSICCVNECGNAASNSKNETELDLILSSSPLVSWRAGTCTLETGRQLFLLTPLPKTKDTASKCPVSSKPLVQILDDKTQNGATLELPVHATASQSAHHDLLEKLDSGVPKTAPVKLVLSTPCMSTSPPKRNILEPLTDDHNYNFNDADDLIKDEVYDGLTYRYQALLGLQPNNKFTVRRAEPEDTLDWFLSPPKTCVLMEPTDEEPLPTPALVIATPLWKDVESTVIKGKPAGETTLKKELWTRFAEVSRDGLHLNASAFPKTTRKGFLDMLEEACEGSDL